MPWPQEIYGRASFTKGLNEIKVMPGIYAKGGFNFEYSKEDKVIHAIEVGAQINAFPKRDPDNGHQLKQSNILFPCLSATGSE